MTIYSQRDSKWKNIKLGFSTSTIGDYGCTITCLAMILDTPPDVVNERLKAVDGFAPLDPSKPNEEKCLLIWDKIQAAFPGSQVHRVWNYNNDDVKANVPNVLVEVDGAPIGGYRHWVVYVGNQKLNDPWTGTQDATTKYPNPLSYCVVKPPVNKPDEPTITMPVSKSDALIGRSVVAKEVGEYLGLTNPDTAPTQDYKNVIGGIKSDATSSKSGLLEVNRTLDIANQEIKNLNDKIANIQDDCQKQIDLKNAQIKALKEGQPNIDKLTGQYEGTIQDLRTQLREAQKVTGIVQKQLAAAKSQAPTRSVYDILLAAFTKLLPFLKKTTL